MKLREGSLSAPAATVVLCREQIAMSRGLTDVPMVVVGNKTDLLSRDMALDKFRHDVVNKVGHRDLIL